MLSSSIANPTDVVKVRMQVVHSNSLIACCQDIYTQEGIRAFWRVSNCQDSSHKFGVG